MNNFKSVNKNIFIFNVNCNVIEKNNILFQSLIQKPEKENPSKFYQPANKTMSDLPYNEDGDSNIDYSKQNDFYSGAVQFSVLTNF